jgi:sulfur carrier protein
MELTVNGKTRSMPDGATVADVIAVFKTQASEHGIAVAVNGEVVPRREWALTGVSDSDKVEVLGAAQGG